MIIASSQVSQASWQWLLRSPVPVVVVNAEPAGLPVPVITGDNVGGTRARDPTPDRPRPPPDRLRPGFADVHGRPPPGSRGSARACAEAGLDPGGDTPIVDGDGLFEGGVPRRRPAARPADADVTAIACHNDVTAIGVMRALRAAGRHVPGEVSVIGCDDIAAASWVSPTLTTVAQEKAEMGRLAVEQLAAAHRRPGRMRRHPPRRSACR